MSDGAPPVEPEEFGPNVWIVDQMYQRYLDAPESVSEAWKEFFSDYRPTTLQSAPKQVTELRPLTPTSGGNGQAGATAAPPATVAVAPDEAEVVELKGGAAVIAERMSESLAIPTATSVRTFPSKLLEVNRSIINNQLARLATGGKVSFTHLIGWAIVKAMKAQPAMNAAFVEVDGKPHVARYRHINLGLAMDVPRKDGSRTLLVPNVKGADEMDFRQFWQAYEDVVRRVRTGKVTPDDFAGTTATLTNPGTVGTVQSVPRLMPGQGVIVGVGRIGYPPEFEGADPETIALAGVGKTLTMTSTYDHRIIQGAESGMFLARIHQLLLGEEDFYEEIFRAMEIPYVPARWAVDSNPPPGSRPWAEKQARVFQLINMYRARGHLIADLDPLRQRPPSIHPELDPLTYGLTLWDLDREFATGGLAGRRQMRLGRILGVLRDAYCRTTGIEYMHIQEPDQKVWIQDHVEGKPVELDLGTKRRILEKLNQAEAFERFLHTKYLGAKRFSLEGAESLIPLLDDLLNSAADFGMDEAVMGMAHRGRLNVLANVVGKPLERIFSEFEGAYDPVDDPDFSGDVKYHLGARGKHEAPSGASIGVEVAANPSHLEAVDPVLEGITRAKQDHVGAGGDDVVLPILIHGDAAFAGQGVVAETLNLSQLPGYYTGGTVHVVVNNQVGFTTSAQEARSSFYATDIAKAVQAPIFHVNGDDPEAVVRAARLAFHFRQAFHKDVVIDLVCYRRLGHNEGDEPTYTQPRMYKLIAQHRSVRKLYLERLVNRGDITLDEGEAALESFQRMLSEAFSRTKEAVATAQAHELPVGPPVTPVESDAAIDTAVPLERLQAIEARLHTLPDGFHPHPKIERLLADRHEMFTDEGVVDWGLGEALAFGSLALEGRPVRLAGEDSQRGTFSHRHAVLVDYETEDEYTPLQHLAPDQAPIRIYDSLLSEFAAMGFEYGYSVAAPETLVLWEAQFGDFVNGAQVIIDQFVASGHDKWLQDSGLTLLLPHGYEGQGPEHSSARLERFLQLAAEDNMRVAVPSTSGQYFHLLRRQARHPVLRPLVTMTPKSLLRTREAFSPVAELTSSTFRKVIPDTEVPTGARRVLLCAGKVYYDLTRHRAEHGVTDVAVVRVEQLYPFPAKEILDAVSPHPDAEIVWVQEEPANMGAWRFMSRYLFVEAGISSRGVYRKESASPATGNPKVHIREQRELVEKAFA